MSSGEVTPSSRELLASRAGRNVARWAQHSKLSREPPDGVDREQARRQMAAARSTIIAVYRELELLDDDDGDIVRAATSGEPQRGLRTQPPDVSPVLHAPAAALLRERLVRVERIHAEGEHATTEALSGPYAELSDALNALMLVGVVSEADANVWRERALERGFGDRAVAAREQRERTRCRLDEVRAVVPGPAVRPSGISVASVELYADGLLVNWHVPGDPPARRPPGEPPDVPTVAIRDDAGTEYLSASGSAGYSQAPSGWVGRSAFVPAPPARARELTVEIRDERFTVELPSEDSTGVVR